MTTITDERRVLTTHHAAEYLGVSRRTVEDWRRRGVGPRYAKVGRAVRYRVEDLDAWLASRSVDNSQVPIEAQA